MTAPDAMLGDYRLHRVLGQGACSTVHLAQDSRSGLWVALKILSATSDAGAAPTELRARFLQEAEIARRLRHPDIVAIHAAGETAGSLWLAMELVRGHALGRYVQPRMLLPPALAVDICMRLARALAHAHAQGVVHRDIKPSNVLVDLPAAGVKLTDFGTARLLEGCQTGTGLLLGTPAYTAPELLAGAVGDAASDLYSLGVVLFELLAGRRPHESQSMGELLRQVSVEAAPDLGRLRPELPAPLTQAVARLLAKRAADRPAGAQAAAAELAGVLAQWPQANGWGAAGSMSR